MGRNLVLADSQGRGWKTLHASLATVNTWSGTHAAHPHHCIAYCVSHPAYLKRRLEGGRVEEMTLRPRQFFTIPGHQPSDWHRRGTTQMLMLYIRQDLIDQVAAEIHPNRPEDTPTEVELPLGTTDPFLEQFALSILSTLQCPEDGSSALYAEALSRAAAVHLVRKYAPNVQKSPGAIDASRFSAGRKLQAVIRLIQSELDSDLGLRRLAATAELSESAFSRAFHEALGQTPHQYVLSQRIEKAKSLLLATELSIAEIALRTGFANQSHLTTAFGRSTGQSPGAFRRTR